MTESESGKEGGRSQVRCLQPETVTLHPQPDVPCTPVPVASWVPSGEKAHPAMGRSSPSSDACRRWGVPGRRRMEGCLLLEIRRSGAHGSKMTTPQHSAAHHSTGSFTLAHLVGHGFKLALCLAACSRRVFIWVLQCPPRRRQPHRRPSQAPLRDVGAGLRQVWRPLCVKHL